MFLRMQRDAQVRACLTTKRCAALSEEVRVHPADASPLARQAADAVQAQLGVIPGGAAGIVRGALDALAMGYAVGELLWADDGTLRKVFWHDPRRFAFYGDPFGDVTALEVLDAQLLFPAERFVVYTYQGRYGSPLGESDLIAAYRPWVTKDALLRQWATALDRFGTPTRIAQVPNNWGQEQVDKLSSDLDRANQNSSLVLPAEVELKTDYNANRIEPGAGFATCIEFCNSEIARSILGQELTTGTASVGGGSYALGQVQQDVADDWIQSLRTEVAEVVLTNQVARRITLYALGPDAPPPILTFPNLSESELAVRRDLIQKLVAGAVVQPSEGWIRAYLGLPEASAPEPRA